MNGKLTEQLRKLAKQVVYLLTLISLSFQTSQTLFYTSKWNSHNVVIVIIPEINSRFWLKVIFLSIFSKLQDVRLVREDEVQKKALQEYDLMQEK